MPIAASKPASAANTEASRAVNRSPEVLASISSCIVWISENESAESSLARIARTGWITDSGGPECAHKC